MKKKSFRNKPKSECKKTYRKMVLTDQQRIDTDMIIQEGVQNYLLIKQAIEAYFIEYILPGRKLIKPGLNSSSLDSGRVYLRTGNNLLAIFQIESGRFLPLTAQLIKKHSR